MRNLILGVTGMAGSHLADYLVSLDETSHVFGFYRKRSKLDNIKHLMNHPKVTLYNDGYDICDLNSMQKLFTDCCPQNVYHLAAQSDVASSWLCPQATMETNVGGTLNVILAMKHYYDQGYSCRLLVVGSSEEYGYVEKDEIPIKETNPLRPLSPYAVSKVATDLLGYQYGKSYGLHIVRTRAFNHTGPRRGDNFAESRFAKLIVEAKDGGTIKVGNLDARRDFTHVLDVVRAYYMILKHSDSCEVYNICSGVSYSIRDVLEKLIGISGKDLNVEKDFTLCRPSDVPILEGDYHKLNGLVGWIPTSTIDVILSDLYKYWEEKVG